MTTMISIPINVFNNVVIAIKLLGIILESSEDNPDDHDIAKSVRSLMEGQNIGFAQQVLDDLGIEDSVFDLDCDF